MLPPPPEVMLINEEASLLTTAEDDEVDAARESFALQQAELVCLCSEVSGVEVTAWLAGYSMKCGLGFKCFTRVLQFLAGHY